MQHENEEGPIEEEEVDNTTNVLASEGSMAPNPAMGVQNMDVPSLPLFRMQHQSDSSDINNNDHQNGENTHTNAARSYMETLDAITARIRSGGGRRDNDDREMAAVEGVFDPEDGFSRFRSASYVLYTPRRDLGAWFDEAIAYDVVKVELGELTTAQEEPQEQEQPDHQDEVEMKSKSDVVDKLSNDNVVPLGALDPSLVTSGGLLPEISSNNIVLSEQQPRDASKGDSDEDARQALLLRQRVAYYKALTDDEVREMQLSTTEYEEATKLLLRHKVQQAHDTMLRSLLSRDRCHLRQRGGVWGAEYVSMPQLVTVRLDALCGLRDKLPSGWYVLQCSVYDRIGGMRIKYQRRIEVEADVCSGCTAPIHLDSHFMKTRIDLTGHSNNRITVSVPGPDIAPTYLVLHFELWKLRCGKYDPVHTIAAWGAWPLLDRTFRVVEGRFKAPLLRGDVVLDTYGRVQHAIEKDLTSWLGNLYFEVTCGSSGDVEESSSQQATTRQQVYSPETTSGYAVLPASEFVRGVDVDPINPLDVARDVESRSMGLAARERDTGLVEVRSPPNPELAQPQLGVDEIHREVGIGVVDSDAQQTRTLLRQAVSLGARGGMVASDDDEPEGTQPHSVAPSKSLETYRAAITSQREFVTLDRRFKDKGAVIRNVMHHDMGINEAGKWDRERFTYSVLCLLFGLYVRMYIHGFGKWSYLTSEDVPFSEELWSPYIVRLRFTTSNRFTPSMTVATMCMGQIMCIALVAFLTMCVMLTQYVFGGFPYALSRILFWLGVASVVDPIVTLIEDIATENWDNGDAFMLYDLFLREEGSGIVGVILAIIIYGGLSTCAILVTYKFWTAFHLNGRINDVYNRLMLPESRLFIPHDLEVSHKDLLEVVTMAKKWRNDRGDSMRVYCNVRSFPTTCLFRNRLWCLLNAIRRYKKKGGTAMVVAGGSAASSSVVLDADGAVVDRGWILDYFRDMKLMHPKGSPTPCGLGSGEIAADIFSFLEERYPYHTQRTGFRLGDEGSDMYYEETFMRKDAFTAQLPRDEAQMRGLLMRYFRFQVDEETMIPCEWETTTVNTKNDENTTASHDDDGNEVSQPVRTDNGPDEADNEEADDDDDHDDEVLLSSFTVYDEQLLADLIFFESDIAARRLWYLRNYTKIPGTDSPAAFDKPGSDRRGLELPGCFGPNPINPDDCTVGAPRSGTFILIYKVHVEMHTTRHVLWRSFVITPRGNVLEPVLGMTRVRPRPGWDADDMDFWVHQLTRIANVTCPPDPDDLPIERSSSLRLSRQATSEKLKKD